MKQVGRRDRGAHLYPGAISTQRIVEHIVHVTVSQDMKKVVEVAKATRVAEEISAWCDSHTSDPAFAVGTKQRENTGSKAQTNANLAEQSTVSTEQAAPGGCCRGGAAELGRESVRHQTEVEGEIFIEGENAATLKAKGETLKRSF